METLKFILLFIAAIVLLIGVIRVLFSPWRGFGNWLLEVMLLDWLIDLFCLVCQGIAGIFSGGSDSTDWD
jgi:hypothetical protein